MKKKIYSVEQVKKIPKNKLKKLLDDMRDHLKHDEIMIGVFNDYDVDIKEIDLIPMMFKDIDVSAKCDHGILYFNYKLLCDGDFGKDYSYAVHEITHYLQQTTGNKPTKSSDDGNYLDNKYEQEGFQNQISYIAKHEDHKEAEDYVDDLLDYHNIKGKDKDNKKDILMNKI